MLSRLILATAVSLVLLAAPARAAEFPDYPFVHTTGTGFTYVAPDLGEIDFEVAVFNPDPALARQAIDERLAQIRALLDQAGVPADDVDIRDVRRDIRKADPQQPGVVLYDLKAGVHIKVKDLSKWKALVGGLIVLPELDGFMVGFDSSRREQIEGELTAQALNAARRKAEAIAGGVGRKLGLASAVSTGDLKNVTRAVGLGGAAPTYYRNPVTADPARVGLLLIGPMNLSLSVDVIYRYK
jgi:uncharacterized protein YggE